MPLLWPTCIYQGPGKAGRDCLGERIMIELKLTQGQVALIDDCDAHLAAWPWYASYSKSIDGYYPYGYFRFFDGGKRWQGVLLHHAILGKPIDARVIDHINGNPLDNRRSNLRIVTRAENSANNPTRRSGGGLSRFVGVRPCGRGWRAEVTRKGTRIHLGVFPTDEDANAARLRFWATNV